MGNGQAKTYRNSANLDANLPANTIRLKGFYAVSNEFNDLLVYLFVGRCLLENFTPVFFRF